MINYFDATVLGIVEGITEFLPISSTAHLILASKILNLTESSFLLSFEIIIQLGAILAVVTLYYREFLKVEVLKRIITGFIPTALVGFFFYKKIKAYLGDISVVLWAILLGGVFLVLFEKYRQYKQIKESEGMTLKQCLVVGCFQTLAFIPGVSRSAATIVGGMVQGVKRSVIAEYSFLLAVPTMCAATGLDIIKNRDMLADMTHVGLLLWGLVVSYIVALLAIRGFIRFLQRHDFVPFGIYRVVLALLAFWFWF